MICKYKKIRTKKGIKYGYCSLHKKEVNLFQCNCTDLEYKEYKKLENKSTIKKSTYKHSKKEKERFSIIYQDMSKCAVCGSKIGHIDKHEVFYGSYRMLSIKYGLVIPLCNNHHTGENGIHNNREMDLFYKRMFQKEFSKHYKEDFISIFKKNYL